jgi:ankyrin repeat protein
MGSCFSHDHTHIPDCCPTSGKWCIKIDFWNQTSIHYALRHEYPESECLRALSKTRHICTQNGTKQSLIRRAILKPYTQLIQTLIDCGVNINDVAFIGSTVLHAAAICQLTEVELLINNGADINILDSWGRTPLHCAVQYGLRNNCILLLNEGANIGTHPEYNEAHSILVAYGHPFRRIELDRLPQYLADSADGAFSRRKAAIRRWYWVHRHE